MDKPNSNAIALHQSTTHPERYWALEKMEAYGSDLRLPFVVRCYSRVRPHGDVMVTQMWFSGEISARVAFARKVEQHYA